MREMTPAEMRTLREALGLPVTWLAEQARVQERTVRHWESGRNAVPLDVASLLHRIDAQFDTVSEQAVLQFMDAALSTRGAPDEVVLLRYRTDEDLWAYQPEMHPLPATSHAAMLQRTLRALKRKGAKTRIVYLDVDAYTAWLAATGEVESPAARSAWAAMYEKH